MSGLFISLLCVFVFVYFCIFLYFCIFCIFVFLYFCIFCIFVFFVFLYFFCIFVCMLMPILVRQRICNDQHYLLRLHILGKHQQWSKAFLGEVADQQRSVNFLFGDTEARWLEWIIMDRHGEWQVWADQCRRVLLLCISLLLHIFDGLWQQRH